jgi:hypothetical protein
MKIKYIKYVIFILLSTLPVEILAGDKLNPGKKHFDTRIQFAGNLGLVSAGIGLFDANKKLHTHFVYGYLPKAINGVEVHTIGIKPSFRFKATDLSYKTKLNFYTGITVFYGFSRNSYLIYPEYFQKGYYKSNALWTSLFLGSKLDMAIENSKIGTVSVFTELGFLDNQIGNVLLTKYIHLYDIVDLSFGVAFTFK